MMALPRPYIPLRVRALVAVIQLHKAGVNVFVDARRDRETMSAHLERRLESLAGVLDCAREDLRLDHNPALVLRDFNKRTGKYKPDANDPDFLIYRTAHDHHIKTNVRGDGALRSDTSERVYRRRVDRNKQKRKVRAKKKRTGAKPRWPSRPLRSANRWPNQGRKR